MAASSRSSLGWIVGLLLAVFGLLCLNYTNGFGIEHHAEWAAEHGAPAPAYPIFVAGAVLVGLGTGVIGWVIGRRARPGA
jgi:hypothetical protein